MSDKSFFNKLNSFWLKLKKQGFTLAEALIITIMTGYCLLPILGTMQNAQTRTQNYDHQSKMQLYSRSRLNAEIANAAFDHLSINTEDEYHYIVYFNNDTTNPNSDPEDMNQAIELPRTTIASLTLLSINDEDKTKWDDQAVNLLGIDKTSTKVPHITIVHAYKTSVEIKEQPTLEYISSVGTPQSLDSPKALLGIVVKTCLLESNGDIYRESDGALGILNSDFQSGRIGSEEYIFEGNEKVPPVTLFSFVNLPSVSDEMIWLADAYNWKIYGIDPVTRTISTTIKLPQGDEKDSNKDNFRPWHLAVHPSLKLLAYETDKYVFLINIDKKSSHYKEIKLGTSKGFTKYAKYGGITFRPDGQCLFLVAKNNQSGQVSENQLIPLTVVYSVNPDTNTLDWTTTGTNKTPRLETLASTNIDLETEEITGFVAANDGYLYVAQKDKKNILRFPMYQTKWSDWASEKFIDTDDKINSIDVSPDGNQIAIVTNEEKLSIYDTRTKKELYKNESIKENPSNKYKNPFKAAFVNYSDSSLNFADAKQLGIAVTNRDTPKSKFFTKFFYGLNSPSPFRYFQNSINDKIRGSNILVSPDNKSVVINDLKKARIYFGKIGTDGSEDNYSPSDERIVEYRKIENYSDDNTEDGEVEDNDNDINDYSTQIATSKRDILAVVEGSDNKTVQLYDLNNMSKLDEESIKVEKPITSLSMSPRGDMLLTGHSTLAANGFGQGNSGITRLFINDLSQIPPNPTPGLSAHTKKIVFDDRFPNMAFTFEYPIKFRPQNDIDDRNDAFWNIDYVNENSWELEGTDSNSYTRKDFDIGPEWLRQDIIGLPKGGAMVLYGKNDGSSMLEWIGRRNWQDDAKKGKYRLFARWTNIYKPTNGTSKNIPSLPNLNKLSTTDSGMGGVFRIEDYLETNTEINSVDFQAADDATGLNNFGDNSTRYITPILFKKDSSNKLKIVNYAINNISSKKGEYHPNEPIIWKYPFNIDKPESYYIGWWNGNKDTGWNGGVVSWNGGTSLSGHFFAELGGSGNTLPEGLIDDNTGYRRNYTIRFKSNPLPPKGLCDFPPKFSKKLAISPDCGTLAILAGEENSKSSLNLFDFNNQIYGPETQIEGMLVDCRKPKAKACSNWPNETGDTSLFDEVNSRSHFNEGKVNTFSKATTNNNYYWSTFNQYPANFYVSGSTNVNYNKRFISYLRPEFEIKYFQSIYSEDIRFFFNQSLLFGAYYSDGVTKIPTSPSLESCAYETNLFQIDQSIDGTNLALAPFITSETSPGDLPTNKHTDDYYYSDNDNWKPIKSDQTYILNNYPSFIGAFNPVKAENDNIDIDSTSMLFSRDKSRPVLFLSDKDFLWTFYKQTLLKTYGTNRPSLNNNTNLVLSTDGQKLLIGDTNKKINAYDISTPDESYFSSSTKSTKSLKVGELSKNYLNLSTYTINLDSNPKYLATKPHTSFKSSPVGGEYKLIEPSEPLEMSPNGVAVASGGIYILKNNSKDIGIYNPLTLPGNITIKTDALNKNSCDSSMTSYDNVLYAFGNNGNGSDIRSARVQSYNVNNEKALSSLDEASYNILTPPKTVTYHHTADNSLEWYDNEGKLVYIRTADSNGSYALHQVYTGNTIDSNGNVTSSSQGWEPNSPSNGIPNPWIRITFETPKVINCIKYANSNKTDKLKVNKFRFYGATNTGDAPGIDNGGLPSPASDWKPINFTSTGNDEFTGEQIGNKLITAELLNTQAYKHYLFQLNSFSYTESKNLRLVAFQFLGITSSSVSSTDDDYMTPILRDNLEELPIGGAAACSTPYGLVITGGIGSDSNTTNKATLYWPHAINKYDGFHREFGISRSLLDMKNKRVNHALVWHKGKIYAIGGRADSTKNNLYGTADFIEFLDYSKKPDWEKYIKPFKYVDGATNDSLNNRYNFGACSFGDEIFIFGGEDSDDSPRTSAVAFNPETGVVRKLTDMFEVLNSIKLKPCVAVPFGSKIYIMGNDKDHSDKLKILEYTP